MSNIDFYVGGKVVCVDVDFQNKNLHPSNTQYPELGKIYTILKIYNIFYKDEDICFLLEEIRNPPSRYLGIEVMFYSWHFRPVRLTNIEIFEAMLNPVENKEKELV